MYAIRSYYEFNVSFTERTRFSEKSLHFGDKDGLQIELVERKGPRSTWSFGGVPVDKAIMGFGGAVLYSTAPKDTEMVLESVVITSYSIHYTKLYDCWSL